jgi:hypothetical protein
MKINTGCNERTKKRRKKISSMLGAKREEKIDTVHVTNE